MKKRCPWVNPNNSLYKEYHDNEWGMIQLNETMLFEMLILEGAQAGLSWETILKKRMEYRKVYHGFDPQKVAQMTNKQLLKLLENSGIIRNKLKIFSAKQNAICFLKIQKEFGSFGNYLWSFLNYKQVVNRFEKMEDYPQKNATSNALSSDLKKRGMKFVGSTIVYAYMQAVGLVNDHTTDCFRYKISTKSANALKSLNALKTFRPLKNDKTLS